MTLQQLQTEPVSRMQQLLHGIRLSASNELAQADDLDRLARLIADRSSTARCRRA